MAKHLLGVLGGMGPAATVDFLQKVIQHTQAGSDQQHIPMLVASMPDIPDRSASILRGGPSPLPALLERLALLEKAGATCVVIPCNTAHFWFEQLKAVTSMEMIQLIDVVADQALEKGFSKVGLLSTDATIATNLYQNALEKRGIECVLPNESLQKEMMEGIYLYKAGELSKAQKSFQEPYCYLQHLQVNAIILGCTEIPIILANEITQKKAYFLDSNDILAQVVVEWHKQKTKL